MKQEKSQEIFAKRSLSSNMPMADKSKMSNGREKSAKEESFEQEEIVPLDRPRGPANACLFAASLSPETTENSLYQYFSEYGKVLKVKLLKDRSSRPYAFVQFSREEDATNALQNSTKPLDGRRLRIEKAKVNRTLFIAKLDRSLTNSQLREIAEEYGQVESVSIIKNHQTNKSKGCGFIKYVYREDAMDAFVGLKNSSQKWVVEWATSNNDPDTLGLDKCSLFIGGLNPIVTKEMIEERFGAYGKIESITLINRDLEIIPEDQFAQRNAFSFIRYVEPSSSANAIEQENGVEWLDRRIRVQYCESQEAKNKRRANKILMNQYGNPYWVSQGPMIQGNHVPMMGEYMGYPLDLNLMSPYAPGWIYPQMYPDSPVIFPTPYPFYPEEITEELNAEFANMNLQKENPNNSTVSSTTSEK